MRYSFRVTAAAVFKSSRARATNDQLACRFGGLTLGFLVPCAKRAPKNYILDVYFRGCSAESKVRACSRAEVQLQQGPRAAFVADTRRDFVSRGGRVVGSTVGPEERGNKEEGISSAGYAKAPKAPIVLRDLWTTRRLTSPRREGYFFFQKGKINVFGEKFWDFFLSGMFLKIFGRLEIKDWNRLVD